MGINIETSYTGGLHTMNYRHYSQVFWQQVEKYGDRVALRYKPEREWRETSWRSFGEQVRAVGKALIEAGIGEQKTAGIFSQNMPEWSIADIGALCIRAIPVPIYPTNTVKQAEYIINDAEIAVLFVGDREQYDKAMQLFGKNGFLKKIVVFNEKLPIAKSADVMYFSDFLAIGRKSVRDAEFDERMSRGTP